MADDNTRDDAERLAELHNVWSSAKIIEGKRQRPKQLFISWKDVDLLMREIDVRNAALRDAGAEIENLQADAGMDGTMIRKLREQDARLRQEIAAKDVVVAAARKLWKIYGTGLGSMREYESWAKEFGDAQIEFDETLARLDADGPKP